MTGTVKEGTVIEGTLDTYTLHRAFSLLLYRQTHHKTPYPEIDDTWWDTDEAAESLNALIDTLDNLAPEGYYFGAHPGDGADFGFWKYESDLA